MFYIGFLFYFKFINLQRPNSILNLYKMKKKILFITLIFTILLIILSLSGKHLYEEKYILHGKIYKDNNTIIFIFSLVFSIIVSFILTKIPAIFRLITIGLLFCVMYFVSIVFLKDFYINIDKLLAKNIIINKVDKYYDNKDLIIKIETDKDEILYFYQKTSLGDKEIPSDRINTISLSKSLFNDKVIFYHFK